MTAGSRLTITALPAALAALLWAAPLSAQNNAQASAPPASAPTSNDTIGPSELRNFSLEGRTTRPAPLVVPPPTGAAPTTSPATTTPTPQPAPQRSRAAPARAEPPQPERPAPATAPTIADRASSVTFSLPSPGSTASPAGEASDVTSMASQPGPDPAPTPQSASIPLDSSPDLWPWLLAALAAGMGLLFYAKRQRGRHATAGGPMPFDAPAPAVAPMPRPAPRPPVRPAPPPESPVSSRSPGMIVSTGLRPRLDIQFMPERLIVDTERTTIQFAATVLNSGNAPARDVLVEAAMFNAGAEQDQEIGAFFAHPLARGERIAEIPPLKSLTLRSEVVLATGQLRLFDVDGRKLFVPLIGFNALYRWSDKDAQTSESFVVGIDTQSEKMGPFRLDGAPRQFRRIAARAHSLRLRK